MKLLTKNDNKVKQGLELTVEELRFLYEIDSNIIGFGYGKDPRINEIINTRGKIRDLAFIFDCRLSLLIYEDKLLIHLFTKLVSSPIGLVYSRHVTG